MNEFENFKKVYIKIISEESKYSDIISPKIHYENKNSFLMPISENELKTAFKNIRYVNFNDELLYTENLIVEAPGTLEYPERFCQKIINMKSYEIIKNDVLYFYIDDNWKYFKKIKNAKKSIIVLKFDFSNLEEIKNIFMNFPYIENIEDSENFNNDFLSIKYHENDKGASMPMTDKVILMFNTKFNLDKLTILHEFTHYLQFSFGVELFYNRKKRFDVKKLKFLNLNNEDLEKIIDILNDKYEIIPYVNEFYEYVRLIFKKSFNKEFDIFFIDFIIQKLINSDNFQNENFVKIYKQISNNNILSLYVILACYVYDVKWEKIKKILIS